MHDWLRLLQVEVLAKHQTAKLTRSPHEDKRMVRTCPSFIFLPSARSDRGNAGARDSAC